MYLGVPCTYILKTEDGDEHSHLAKYVEDWSGQVWNHQDWSGLVRTDQDRPGLVRNDQDW